MLGRAPMLLSGDAVVQAFKSYGNDLPSPSVVSQIQLTGEVPTSILERGASALSVVGEGVRSLSRSLFGEPAPAITPDRGVSNEVRPAAHSDRPGTFTMPAEQPTPGGAVSQQILPGTSAPVGGEAVTSMSAGGGEVSAIAATTSPDISAVPDARAAVAEPSIEDATPDARFGALLERSVTRIQSIVTRIVAWLAGLF